ncbi:MAG: hypothetical protein Unbinned1473contig1000_65 [Prokaryotic dsDNA virus sp.]|nr:MAG: hypothetical protein Unbinned1473contig1000_65 [Prokaryotic dsDNA virus sp.]|tara:strand:- start:2087 stop:2410 length:324 start_codon:yes stop_codon:yes gene_type:complete
MSTRETRIKIIEAGKTAVDELIKVAKEKIIKAGKKEEGDEKDLSADRLKNAAATKKLAVFDAFEILSRIESEQKALDEDLKSDDTEQPIEEKEKTKLKQGFAERRAE